MEREYRHVAVLDDAGKITGLIAVEITDRRQSLVECLQSLGGFAEVINQGYVVSLRFDNDKEQPQFLTESLSEAEARRDELMRATADGTEAIVRCAGGCVVKPTAVV